VRECDVAIVGCGPTGVVLANLLGDLGVRVEVLERERDVYPIPRATHVDEETLRNFQTTGLIDDLLPHTSLFGGFEVLDHDGTLLLREEVVERDSVHGYVGSRFFDQPAFERVLRDGLERYASVRLETGVDVTSVETTADSVVATASGERGKALTVVSSWCVGCDGGRSVVRRAIDVPTDSLAPPTRWMVVDTLLRDPSDAALLPDCFRYMLDPARLTVYAHGFGRNRRWEFQLGADESVPSRDEVIAWVARFVDLSRLEVTRIITYAHNALVARSWRKGRLLIAGDSAHMMPPSAGQGMCSGIRDAVNLAWKLARAVEGRAKDCLLDSYESERVPHVREILEGTLAIGRQLKGDTRFQRWRRRTQLKLVASVPPLREYLRRQSLRRPALGAGALDGGSRVAGKPIPQVDVVRNGVPCRLDDVLGYRFALLVRDAALADEHVEWANAHGVRIQVVGRDFVDTTGGLDRWMRERDLDFALARPDRYLFAGGRASDLDRSTRALDAWLA